MRRISSDTKKFIAVTVIVGLGMAGDAMIYCLLPVIPEKFNISIFQIGVLLSVNRFVRIVTNEASSRLVVRLSSDKPLIIAVCLSIFITLGYAVPLGFWWLFFLRALWGACFSLLRIEGLISAIKYSGRENMSRYIAWYETIKSQIYGVITIVSGILADIIPPLLVPVILAALTALSLLFFRGRSDLMSMRGMNVDAAKKRASGKVSNVRVLVVLGFVILVSAVFATMLTALRGRAIVDYILPGAGFAVGAATFQAFFQVAGQIVLCTGPLFGRICDKAGRRRSFIVVFFVQTAIILALASSGLWYVVFAAFAVQLFTGVVSQILRSALPGEYADPSECAVFMNRTSTFQDVGSAIGPFVGYALYAGTGSFVPTACIMVPCLLAAAFALKKL